MVKRSVLCAGSELMKIRIIKIRIMTIKRIRKKRIMNRI